MTVGEIVWQRDGVDLSATSRPTGYAASFVLAAVAMSLSGCSLSSSKADASISSMKDSGGNADCSQPPPGPTEPMNCGTYYVCADGTWQRGIVLFCPADGRPLACGDGVMDVGEECDDGNTAGGEGCSSSCHVRDAGDVAQ